jgi:hypothetical protein
MPRVSQAKLVQMEGYKGGLNKDADVARLSPDEMPEALNVIIGLRGEVTKRRGYVRFDTNLTTRITWLHSWRDNQARSWLVGIDENGQIYYTQDTGTTFTNSTKNIGPGGSAVREPVATTVANGKLYVSSRRGHDTQRWDGTTWATVAAVPKAQFSKWRFEQFFVANIAGSPSQLRVSLELNPEDFTTEPAVFDFDSDDGTEIRALAPSGDDLLVFKDHSIHIFSGKVRSDFQKYRLDSLRGTYSPRSVEQVRGLIIFYDRDTGVWAWDGAEFTLISEKINEYLLDSITYEASYLAAAYVRRDSYYLSVPWLGGSTNQRTFVFSTLNNSWTEWDYGAADAESHVNHDFLGGPRGDVGVYESGIGFLDKSSPILVRFKTPWMNPGGPGSLARLRRLEANMAKTDATVSVSLYHEYDSAPVLTRAFVAANPNKSNESDMIKNLDGWGGRADAHQLEFSSIDDKALQLNSANALFTVIKDTLGEHV